MTASFVIAVSETTYMKLIAFIHISEFATIITKAIVLVDILRMCDELSILSLIPSYSVYFTLYLNDYVQSHEELAVIAIA